MLEARSPLGVKAHFETAGVTLSEDRAFTLTLVAGDEKALKKALVNLPATNAMALATVERTIFRISPKQVQVLGTAPAAAAGIYITPLSSGRTRITLTGSRARDLLATCALIDFHEDVFKPGNVAHTGIHHTPVTIHCVDANTFHIYALRTFALNTWEWLCDAAQGLAPAHA